MKHLTKSDEEEKILDDLAHDFTYTAVRFSGLHRLLENDEWDSFADELKIRARALVSQGIDQRLAQIEAAREARAQQEAA
jgi:hypothetical protein